MSLPAYRIWLRCEKKSSNVEHLLPPPPPRSWSKQASSSMSRRTPKDSPKTKNTQQQDASWSRTIPGLVLSWTFQSSASRTCPPPTTLCPHPPDVRALQQTASRMVQAPRALAPCTITSSSPTSTAVVSLPSGTTPALRAPLLAHSHLRPRTRGDRLVLWKRTRANRRWSPASEERLGSGRGLKAIVIGALGRCGTGAVDLLHKAGLEEDDIMTWDMAETAKGGPFQEMLDVDIFVNCIYLSSPIPPFITKDQIAAAGRERRLRVAVDVSCDTTNPHNPIPIYSFNTPLTKPTVPVEVGEGNPPMAMVLIDQLPTLLPREASEQFSANLLPSLLELPHGKTVRVWIEARNLLKAKLATL